MTPHRLAILPAGTLVAAALLALAPATGASSCRTVGGPTQFAAMVVRPENCCSGTMHCAQLLSTVRVMRPGHERHV